MVRSQSRVSLSAVCRRRPIQRGTSSYHNMPKCIFMLQPSSAASSCAPFTLPPGAEYSGGVHWYVRGVLKKKAWPTQGSSIGWYSCSCGGGHKRLEEKKERSKLGHSGSCKSEMSHCCLMEFSAAPLWKSWHAVSLLPDGGPLGSCFHGALFYSTTR